MWWWWWRRHPVIVAAVNVHRRVPCYLVAIWGQKIGKVRVSGKLRGQVLLV